MVAISRTRITALHARNLATLSQLPTSTSSLAPPYSHSINSAQSKFRPPYAHSISSPSSAKLAAPYKYSLVPPSRAHDEKRVETFNSWVQGLLQSEKGRAEVVEAWTESVNELARMKSVGVSGASFLGRAIATRLKSSLSAPSTVAIGGNTANCRITSLKSPFTPWHHTWRRNRHSKRSRRPVRWSYVTLSPMPKHKDGLDRCFPR
jgi:hypothetical protein